MHKTKELLLSAATAWVDRTSRAAPIDRAAPSAVSPFVFFHLRKCGGSSMRVWLHAVARRANVTPYIPCFDGVRCTRFTLSRDKPPHPAVLGGHLYFADVRAYLRRTQAAPGEGEQAPKFNCFTMLRNPLSRVRSCWNYRFVQRVQHGPRLQPFDETPPPELVRVLLERSDRDGHGCLNEPLRIFADGGMAEAEVSRLASPQPPGVYAAADSGNASHGGAGTPSCAFSASAPGYLTSAVTNMLRCAPLVLERCHESRQLLSFMFPGLAIRMDCHRRANVGKLPKKPAPSNHKALPGMGCLLSLEQHVYRVANEALTGALRAIRARRRNSTAGALSRSRATKHGKAPHAKRKPRVQ